MNFKNKKFNLNVDSFLLVYFAQQKFFSFADVGKIIAPE